MQPTVESERRLVRVEVESGTLEGELVVPRRAGGLVVFAHGSGSSRLSPRNQSVARLLERAGLGTLLFDLLTAEEAERDARTGELRFDIELLSARLLRLSEWLERRGHLARASLGYFGASTGAAAALLAAARRQDLVRAVVARGGRPDLAATALHDVVAPTLLIVGGDDTQVVGLNEWALERLAGPRALEVVEGATHLFEEPGALRTVAELAERWFSRHLIARESPR